MGYGIGGKGSDAAGKRDNDVVGYNYYFDNIGHVHENCAAVEYCAETDTFGADPLFVDAEAGDYRLKPASPALGKAQNGANPGAF